MPRPSNVWSALDSLHRGHDFVMPLAGNFRGRFLREISNARLEINPELRAKLEVHERLAARANPRRNAPCQSAAVAGRGGPLFRASSTHC
jgi:hypothetical protein